jgi:outer membrane lipoprotein-sorting protein
MNSLIGLTAVLAAGQATSIDRYIEPQLHDASFTVRVIRANQSELEKINKDFGQSFRFETTDIRVKEPFKLRIDAKVEDTHILYTLNGTHLMFHVGQIRRREDLSRAPGRRQTMLDFGLLTPSLFENFFDAKFVRMDRATGDAVFDVTYIKSLDDSARYRIWVDPAKHLITKREWYNLYGTQIATFLYENPKEVGGVWLATKVEVKNMDNVVAGITTYEAIKVNTGLNDSMFNTN